MRFLTCEPNFENVNNYYDEADKFWINPTKWFQQNQFELDKTTHIVLFENLLDRFLKSNITTSYLTQFKICKKFFHSFAKATERTDRYMLLMCKNDQINNKDTFNLKNNFKNDEL